MSCIDFEYMHWKNNLRLSRIYYSLYVPCLGKADVVELGFMFIMFDEARPSVLGPADSDNQTGRSPEVVSSFGQ